MLLHLKYVLFKIYNLCHILTLRYTVLVYPILHNCASEGFYASYDWFYIVLDRHRHDNHVFYFKRCYCCIDHPALPCFRL